MKTKLLLTILILGLSTLISAQVAKHPPCKPLPNTISVVDKVYFLSYFWSEVKYNFVFFDELDFCWDSLFRATIPKVIATKNDFEFYRVIQRFAASLGDGHTEIFDGNQFFNYIDYVPFLGRFVGNNFYITSVRKPFDEILPPGSKVIEVNGLPIGRYFEEKIFPFINSQSPSTIRFRAASRIFAADLIRDSLQLRFITPNNETRFHVFARDGEATRIPEEEVFAGVLPRFPRQAMSLSWENNNIAHLAINTFNFNAERTAMLDSLLNEISTAEGLIIDLRFNGGGSTLVAFQLLERISKQEYFLGFGYQTRVNDGVRRANGNRIERFRDYFSGRAFRTHLPDTMRIPDTVKKFDMPIIILISEFTFSAAEDFLVMLYEMENRPLLVGTPTSGSTGSPLVIATGMIGENFPGGGWARICTRRVLFPRSLKPFNNSIMPDVLVEYNSIEEYLLGKDKVFETALEMMNKIISSSR